MDLPGSAAPSKSSKPLGLYLLICLLAIGLWIIILAPIFKKLPNNFDYRAELLSLDNLYDSSTGSFEGKQISNAQFGYAVAKKMPRYWEINHIFSASKRNNEPIVSIMRKYYIDPLTGKHVSNAPGQKRNGYLFAPRYLPKTSFIYWHVNYDLAINMQYKGEEEIDGLTIYRFEANFIADQGKELSGLLKNHPGKTIRTQVHLTLWLEPISGWLVKYKDESLATFYDKTTGKKLEPWNQFSNQFTQTATREKIAEAKFIKWQILFIDFGIPTLLLIITLVLCFKSEIVNYLQFLSFKNIHKSHINLRVFLILPIIFVIVISSFYIFDPAKANGNRIGISQWSNNPDYVAAIQGFKDGLKESGFYEGLNIEFLVNNPNSNEQHQIEIIEYFEDKNVDVIFTLGTSGTLIARGVTNKTPILFADISYPNSSALASYLAANKNNITGISSYISPAEQFFYFEIINPHVKKMGFVYKKGDPDSKTSLQEFKDLLQSRNIKIIPLPSIDTVDMQKQITNGWKHQQFDSLYFTCDTLIRNGGGTAAAKLTRELRIPAFSCDKQSIKQGVLVGYLPDMYTSGKLAGYKAALLLQGADISWLGLGAGQKGSLLINLPTARSLNLSIPVNDIEVNTAPKQEL
jgi:putative ABC transport system substrate-binding protein